MPSAYAIPERTSRGGAGVHVSRVGGTNGSKKEDQHNLRHVIMICLISLCVSRAGCRRQLDTVFSRVTISDGSSKIHHEAGIACSNTIKRIKALS